MPRTIILIDDDSDDLELMQELIREIDPLIECVPFESPEEAVRQISKQVTPLPQHIFIDINMPRMTGDECLRSLKKLPQLQSTALILYSTTMSEEMSQLFLKLGANFTFQKPSRMADYVPILKSILYKSPQ